MAELQLGLRAIAVAQRSREREREVSRGLRVGIVEALAGLHDLVQQRLGYALEARGTCRDRAAQLDAEQRPQPALILDGVVRDTARGIRTKAVVLVTGIGAAAVLACWLLPSLAINAVAGPSYSDITGYVWVFALTGTGFGVVQVILYSQLAASQRLAAVTLWVGALAVIVLGSTVGAAGPPSLAATTATVAWTLAAISVVVQRRVVRRRSSESV